jgi:hypothetical protein
MTKEERFEKSIESFVTECQHDFELKDCIAAIDEKQGLPAMSENDICDLLVSGFAFSKNFRTFTPRHRFFQDARFLVFPRANEIKLGFLIPGHRFHPFYSPQIFPWECSILTPEKQTVPRRIVSQPLSEMEAYYNLLGTEMLPAYLFSDNETNAETLNKANYDDSTLLKITAFDFAELYRKWDFAPGDALLLEVNDWQKGAFSVEPVAKKRLRELTSKSKHWDTKLEKGLKQVFENFNTRLPIDEQIAWGYFFTGKDVLKMPAMSFEDFVEKSHKVYIVSFGRENRLWNKKNVDMSVFDNYKPPEYSGFEDSFNELLEAMEAPFSDTVVEAYIKDELFHHHGIIPDELVKKIKIETEKLILDMSGVGFSSEQQAEQFSLFFTLLWETTLDSYNFFADQATGKIRAQMLDVLARYYAWLREADTGINPDAVPIQDVLQLTQTVQSVVDYLELIDNGKLKNSEELDEIIDEFPDVEATIEEIKEKIVANNTAKYGKFRLVPPEE